MTVLNHPISIRPIEARDAARWRVLWDGYCRFYEREPNEAVTQHTWSRLLDPHAPVYGIVAEREQQSSNDVVGIANYVIHENTGTLAPVCYLQDLFVNPGLRGDGVGRALIDWLVAETRRQGWARLYWQTKENNERARRLYDAYTLHSGFVRYVLKNPDSAA